MRYMCAERNKLQRVFSTAIDLVKAQVIVLLNLLFFFIKLLKNIKLKL